MKFKLINLIPYMLLAVVVFISYHQLLQMYFWRDDYTGLYFAQRGYLSNQPAFAYPYHINLLIVKLAWEIFGLNVINYFLTLIALYIASSWMIFYFLQKLLKDRVIAFFSTLVFAAGYIGQDGMKMIVEGIGALPSLIVFFFSLISLLVYLQKSRKVFFLISLITFFLTLEIMPQRMAGSIIILLVLDWIFSWKKEKIAFLVRSVLYICIFLIQYFLHPSVFFLGYKIVPSTQYLSFFTDISIWYFLNPLGTFWNLIFPLYLQEKYNMYIGIYSFTKEITFLKFWLSGFPTTIFIFLCFLLMRIIRPNILAKLKMILGGILMLSFVWAFLIYKASIDKYDLIAIYNGGIFLVFIIFWITNRLPKFQLFSIFSMTAIFSIMSTFFLFHPNEILVSYNRYLLLPASMVVLLPIIFITSECYQKNEQDLLPGNKLKRKFAWILFLLTISVLVLPRLFSALSSQNEFVRDYSFHAKKIYQQLRQIIPNDDRRKMIFIEGDTKELNFSVGDAARVGNLPTEAAWAVNFGAKLENFILPQTLDEIPKLFQKNPDLSKENVHTFIYTEQGLKDTSQVTRKLLLER